MTQSVQARFPRRQAEIHALYLRSREFRSLCHDFGLCLEEIEQLNDSNDLAAESKSQRLEQYRELERELEAEIVEELNTALSKSGQVSPQRKENHVRKDSQPS